MEANKADDPTSPFTALLNYPNDNTASNVALGTDYSRNVWLAYPRLETERHRCPQGRDAGSDRRTDPRREDQELPSG